MWLSFGWPGAGHLYAGRTQDGAVLSFVCVSLIASGLVELVIGGPVLGAAACGSGVALYAAIDSSRAISESRGR